MAELREDRCCSSAEQGVYYNPFRRARRAALLLGRHPQAWMVKPSSRSHRAHQKRAWLRSPTAVASRGQKWSNAATHWPAAAPIMHLMDRV